MVQMSRSGKAKKANKKIVIGSMVVQIDDDADLGAGNHYEEYKGDASKPMWPR